MVTVLAQVGPGAAELIRSAVPEVTVIDVPMKGEVPADVAGEVLLTPVKFTDNLAELLGRGVRWVHEFGTGVDAVPLDLVFDEPGRVLTCSRGASAIPIAEWVLAQMLAFEKRLPGVWLGEAPAHWNFSDPLPGEIHGRVLGLVGLGGIGTRVAELALAFGMEVRALRRSGAPSGIDGVTVVPSLADLLAGADHVVLAAPATAATRHLIDAAALAGVKPGVHLVNVGRGSLIDQDALRAALDDGRVALASLDVVDPEPLPAGHWMYEHPRVRVSPHVSWGSGRGMERILDGFVDNLRRYVKGEPLLHVVDPGEGY